MDALLRQIRLVRRRLVLQRFLDILGWACFGTLLAALLLITISRFWPLGVDAWAWAIAAIAFGFLIAAAHTFWSRPALLEAAMELDRRFELKERVSSALALTPEDRETEVGEALLADAAGCIENLDVGGRFRVTPSRRLLLPLAPGVLAAIVALFVGQAVAEKKAIAKTEPALEQIQKATDTVRRQAAEQREKAKREGLQDAEKLFTKIEKETHDLKLQGSKEKALAKLNDLTKTVAERRQKFGGAEKVKQQLEQLQKTPRGPADKFAKAMSQCDFSKAMKELNELQSKLEHGKLDAKQKAALAEQIEKMKEKLDKAQKAHEAAQKDLERQIKEQQKAGNKAEAQKLQEKLDQLKKQNLQMQQMQGLAQKLGQCSKCLREGDAADAAKSLAQMQADMKDLQEQMQGQLDEMKMLDDAQSQLAQAKDCMNCDKCGGQGCDACMGGQCNGEGDGDGQWNKGEGGGHGSGIGTAHGTNFRRGPAIKPKVYDSQVKQRAGQGAATMVELVDGPNIKGNVQQQIQQQVESTKHGETDPLTNRHMPRKHGEHAKEYFDGLREN